MNTPLAAAVLVLLLWGVFELRKSANRRITLQEMKFRMVSRKIGVGPFKPRSYLAGKDRR